MKNMTKGATLSKCLTFRWTLTRDWGQSKRACWVMLNPSDADDELDDPTIRRVIHFSNEWRYRGVTVVNLYPYRSPDPEKCKEWATTRDRKLTRVVEDAMRRNAAIVAEHCRAASMVVAAWGNNPWDLGLLESVVGVMLAGRACPEIYCLGTTGRGAPKHPMARGKHRVPDNQQPVLWRGAD